MSLKCTPSLFIFRKKRTLNNTYNEYGDLAFEVNKIGVLNNSYCTIKIATEIYKTKKLQSIIRKKSSVM